jgi:DNA-binding NarL/FixJ family response regulator
MPSFSCVQFIPRPKKGVSACHKSSLSTSNSEKDGGVAGSHPASRNTDVLSLRAAGKFNTGISLRSCVEEGTIQESLERAVEEMDGKA